MKALARILLGVGITIVIFPSTPVHINNSAEAEETPQTVQAQLISKHDEASPQPPKPVEPETQPEAKTGCDNYVHLIQKYDWNVTTAINVMRAESGCRPTAVGDTKPIKGVLAHSCGLFQVRTLRGRPSCEELKNPETNVAWAYKLYVAKNKHGKQAFWSPWSVCRGKVRCM
jgi:hypothetical protein